MEEAENNSSKVVTNILMAIVVVAIMAYPVSQFFGISFSFSDNVLEKALRVGVSERASFEVFVEKGGLTYESSWLGYGVKEITPRYYPNGKLGMIDIVLWKDALKKKMASIDNLKSSLKTECGSTWQVNTTYYEAEKGDVKCGLQYLRDGSTHVVIVKRQS